MNQLPLVIHCPNDGALLEECYNKLLEIKGIEDCDWNNRKKPHLQPESSSLWAKQHGREVWYYTLIVRDDRLVEFHNHDCEDDTWHIDLTRDNLQSIIDTVALLSKEMDAQASVATEAK